MAVGEFPKTVERVLDAVVTKARGARDVAAPLASGRKSSCHAENRADAPSFGVVLEKGGYRARLAQNPQDLAAARVLRSQCFGTPDLDRDSFDVGCLHVLIEEVATGVLLCCFRLRLFCNGAEVSQSYSAQFYDLSKLQAYAEPLAEMGRFCLCPEASDVDVLRLAWAAATLIVDQEGVELLFGCSSFEGAVVKRYEAAFALLNYRHLAPDVWRPERKAQQAYAFSEILGQESKLTKPNLKQALAQMPPLLRSYLGMGGWVSDHVVVDPILDTLHVFTAVEVGAIPMRRKKMLREAADRPA